ncbi:Argonaute complex, subunit Arb1 [Fusarium flagelliforme]|uniref:Argonaute complex, subunit Arb1 n=1 Tax=Fusarium flagelliforme TaxID=2675880 RepID=UPI001E8CC8F7|nr:Argonaute complex, subunit Arb1 [Fusarium flagelliforme]KAH7182530.1 Argonaute complex, subunit Arb1 [Fusarium flagelliforme]
MDNTTNESTPHSEDKENMKGEKEEPYLPPPTLPASLQGVAKQGKSRSGNKPLSHRGPGALPKNRGTGFEEFYADPPMTPNEAKEEKDDIYALRMQACIQRFRSRRRLQGTRTRYFEEYLFLGGVDCQPNTFGGLSQKELKELTPAERREATAKDIIWASSAAGQRYYNGDKEAWSVDFPGVAAGFFSVTLVQLTSFEYVGMMEGISTVENFLRYVLQHNVCPEYEDDVKAAMEVCKTAAEEWPMIRQLCAALPGHFNLAAAELFCPETITEESWSFLDFKRPEDFDPTSVFFTAFALMDEPDLFEKLTTKRPTITREFDCTLELVEKFRPSDDIVKRVKSLVIGDKAAYHAPVGKAIFKQGVIEDDWERPPTTWPIEEATMTLFFDDALLANMVPGMKIEANICELDAGLRFVKGIENIVPSFYVYLPQEMMRHYKEPKENDRPAPSVNDPQDGRDDDVAKKEEEEK